MAIGQETTVRQTGAAADDQLASLLVRDLVERFPETMTVLSPLGLDLCCGGGHALGDALDLHGLDRAAVLAQVSEVIAAAQGR